MKKLLLTFLTSTALFASILPLSKATASEAIRLGATSDGEILTVLTSNTPAKSDSGVYTFFDYYVYNPKTGQDRWNKAVTESCSSISANARPDSNGKYGWKVLKGISYTQNVEAESVASFMLLNYVCKQSYENATSSDIMHNF